MAKKTKAQKDAEMASTVEGQEFSPTGEALYVVDPENPTQLLADAEGNAIPVATTTSGGFTNGPQPGPITGGPTPDPGSPFVGGPTPITHGLVGEAEVVDPDPATHVVLNGALTEHPEADQKLRRLIVSGVNYEHTGPDIPTLINGVPGSVWVYRSM